MKSVIAKRSVVIDGHKTSVSLEEPFWQAIREITAARDITVSALLHEIDCNRQQANLSSAVRVFVLEQVRGRAAAVAQCRQGATGAPTLPPALPPTGLRTE